MTNTTSILLGERVLSKILKERFPMPFKIVEDSISAHHAGVLYLKLYPILVQDFLYRHPDSNLFHQGKLTKTFARFVENWKPSEPVQ